MERISEDAKARIAQLWSEGAPAWLMRKEAGVSRHGCCVTCDGCSDRRQPEPVRSPLRLSLAEREEISRGLAGGESLRAIACGWVGHRRR